MKLPDNDCQILKLTDIFYCDYPNPPYTELLKKRKRAYNCLLFQTHYDYFICIPFRSEIKHQYAFRFKKSKRSKNHRSGLDYTKMVIINKMEYLDTEEAIIDKDEYKETMVNVGRIKKEALKFVEDYITYMNGNKILHSSEFGRRYTYSTLKYFHNELGIKQAA